MNIAGHLWRRIGLEGDTGKKKLMMIKMAVMMEAGVGDDVGRLAHPTTGL